MKYFQFDYFSKREVVIKVGAFHIQYLNLELSVRPMEINSF